MLVVSPSVVFTFLDLPLNKLKHRRFQKTYRGLVFAETAMDVQASAVKAAFWMRGLWAMGGFEGAHKAAAGLVAVA